MASTPKKPRTGDAPAVDEQPGVEEKPEVDGNPAVDAPRLEQESSSDVPLVRQPPRLRAKGCRCVQFHMSKAAMSALFVVFADENEEPPAVRVLLINRRWLQSFFVAADFGTARISFNIFGQLHLAKPGRRPRHFGEGAVGIAALLRLNQEVTEIDVRWTNDPVNGSFGRMREWMQVVSQLRALPNLTVIRLTAVHLGYFYARFFADSLPDRLVRVETDNLRMATLLRKRTTPLESLTVRTAARQHSYIADVLRLKSHRITLAAGPPDGSSHVHPLHDCGPLSRNEHLQELHIRAESQAEIGTPQALRHLRSINDHFKLVCHESYGASMEGLPDVEDMEDIAEEAKEFSVLMAQAGFDSASNELRIIVEDSEKWRHVSHEQAFERLQWTREGEIPWPKLSKSLPACSLVHEGVRILIGLSNRR